MFNIRYVNYNLKIILLMIIAATPMNMELLVCTRYAANGNCITYEEAKTKEQQHTTSKRTNQVIGYQSNMFESQRKPLPGNTNSLTDEQKQHLKAQFLATLKESNWLDSKPNETILKQKFDAFETDFLWNVKNTIEITQEATPNWEEILIKLKNEMLDELKAFIKEHRNTGNPFKEEAKHVTPTYRKELDEVKDSILGGIKDLLGERKSSGVQNQGTMILARPPQLQNELNEVKHSLLYEINQLIMSQMLLFSTNTPTPSKAQLRDFKRGLVKLVYTHVLDRAKGAHSGEPRQDNMNLEQLLTLLRYITSNKFNLVYEAERAPISPIIGPSLPTSCVDIEGSSGVYKLMLPNSGLAPFEVYCRKIPDDGPHWTIIQRRKDGSESFFRDWLEYKLGFGNLAWEHFIGLEKLHALTKARPHELWIEMGDWQGQARLARYTNFQIGNESSDYALQSLGWYTGNAGNSLSRSLNAKFSTKDCDNTAHPMGVEDNPALYYRGAWWFNDHLESNLNGEYLTAAYPQEPKGRGIIWSTFRGHAYSLQYVLMAIRPVDYIDQRMVKS